MADIKTSDLTTQELRGTGVFDVLMRTIQLRLDEQHQNGRLTGADYTQVYLGSLIQVLQLAQSFVLGEQQADKQADLIAQQILNAQSERDNTIAQLAQINSQTALIDQQLANAIIEGTNLTKLGLKIDAEKLLVDAQVTKVNKDIELTDVQIASETQNTLVLAQEVLKRTEEVALTIAQTAKVNQDVIQSQQVVTNLVEERLKIIAETSLLTRNEANAVIQGTLLTNQGDKVLSEVALLDQKKLTEEAAIVDRVTGATEDVAGTIGKQKTLYTSQADGFDRDAEQKAAKLFADIYSVRKSTDPAGTVTPSSVSDTNTDLVINKLRTGVGAV